MATAIVLYGPKAVGKSWVAQVLGERLGAEHVDADELVLDLLAAGTRPDPGDGWLPEVHRRVVDALQRHAPVSVEATGAWDSNWRLADDLEAPGAAGVGVGAQGGGDGATGPADRPAGPGVGLAGELDLRPGDDPGGRSAVGRPDRHRPPQDPASLVALLGPILDA
jgi:hypothetical protein